MVQNHYFYVAQKEFWSYFMNLRENIKLFKYNINEGGANLFNKIVTVINIETSSMCNRKCAYCPVSYKPERKQAFMDNTIWMKIINELKEIDYRGIISLSLYNEPLASRNILEKIQEMKKACPYGYIRLNSNGDYLTRKLLDELVNSGLDEILVTLHMNSNEEYSDALAEAKIDKFFQKLGLDFNYTHYISGHNISCDIIYRTLRFLVVTNNWKVDGVDRGGEITFLSQESREQPCAVVFREMAIDISGNVRRCCNMYIDSPCLGNIRKDKIVDIYFSKKMVDLRRNLFMFGEKVKPCNSCCVQDNARVETKTLRERMLEF